MSLQEASVAPPKLSVSAIVSEAYGAVFGRFWLLCKAAALPVFLSLLISVPAFLVAEAHFALDIGTQLLSLLPLAVFGIAWGRIVLIGPQSGAVPKPLFGRRTWIYLGFILVHMLLIIIPMIAVTVAFFGVAILSGTFEAGSGWESDPATIALSVFGTFGSYLILLYFSIRLALVFPAVTVDHRLGLAGSWRLTRGNGLRLYLGMVLIMIPVVAAGLIATAVLGGFLFGNLGQTSAMLGDSAGEVNWITLALVAGSAMILSILSQFVTFGLIAAAFAKVYAHLSGWGGVREEVLERFE